ncbi:MAG: helix-turn-helix domain-containing protein [Flavobacteriaceae bacterium]|nr:helix-turn-helix domain-containing protein [Flavobacteriaceae bacterium]
MIDFSSFFKYSYLVMIGITLVFYSRALIINLKVRQDFAFQGVARYFLYFCIGHNLYLFLTGSILGKESFAYDGEPFFLFYGPILYVFVCLVDTEKNKKLRLQDHWIHFLLGGVYAVLYFFFVLLEKYIDKEYFYYYNTILFNAIALQFIGYALFVYYKSGELKIYRRLKLIVFRIVVVFLLMGIVYMGVLVPTIRFDVEEFILCSMAFVLSVVIYQFYVVSEKELIAGAWLPKAEAGDNQIMSLRPLKYVKSSVKDTDLYGYQDRVETFLVKKERFLDTDYSLDKLAKDTKISKHHISQLFSTVYNSSFTKYVNRLRVMHSLTLIEQDNSISIGELGAQSGFNSRTSFFRAFKDVVGMSPSEYIQSIKQQEV